MNIDCSKSQIKKIGEKLRHNELLSECEEKILATFRRGHQYIIESFRNKHKSLMMNAKWKKHEILFATRLKKRQTLINKLSSRHNEMDLTRMNDIAGCRLIFTSIEDLNSYRNEFNKKFANDKIFHKYNDDEKYNFIDKPRDTGYRGIHDVYEEISKGNNIKAKIEIQYRTTTQHSWATALEIWDQDHKNGAKFGLENTNVQKLFSLYSELLWRFHDCNDQKHRNKINISDEDLYKTIRNMERELGVLKFLTEKQVAKTNFKANKNTSMILLKRTKDDEKQNSSSLEAKPSSWESINEELFIQELQSEDDLVLVQTNPKTLKRAYNNYFNDPRRFIKKVRTAMQQLYLQRRFLTFRNQLDSIFIDD